MTGQLLPYQLRTDDALTITLFICAMLLVLTAVVIGHPLLRRIEQMPLFAYRQNDKTGKETPGGVQPLMMTHAALIIGAFAWAMATRVHPDLPMLPIPTAVLLIAYIVIGALYLCFCRWFYQFVGWLFFEPAEVKWGVEGWLNSACLISLLMFPLTLLAVYFSLPIGLLILILFLVLFFPGVLLFYWLKKLFYANFYGSLLLILYLCALEIFPMILMALGIEQLNRYLLLNY